MTTIKLQELTTKKKQILCIKIRILIRLFINVIRLTLMGNTNINKNIGELYYE
nr:MAG TPA: hypothetical protein [Crassvirales sp.]